MPDPFLGKLLVAVDGSEMGDYALNVTVDLGEKFLSEIDIIHVSNPRQLIPIIPIYDPIMGTPVMTPPVMIPQESEEKLKMAETSLLSERQKIVTGRNLKCETISVESDDMGGSIITEASKGGYDLIVVGSRGLSGLRGLLLGSTSKKVAKESKKSVLIVSSRISKTPKFLLGYDGSEESKAALDVAKNLGKKFGAEVDTIGIVSIPVSTEGYIVSGIDRWEKEMQQSVDEATNNLRAEGIQTQGMVIDSGDVSKAIIDTAKRGSYDFVVLGSRGYGRLKSMFLGSVAGGVADSAVTNVWIVREGK